MRALPRPFPRTISARTALLLAAACFVTVSVVQASIRASTDKPVHVHRRFEVYGRLARPLAPGGSEAVPLFLRNRMRATLWITSIRVGVVVDRAHAAVGCSGSRDFVVAQLPTSAYPIRLPPKGILRRGWLAPLREPAWRRRSLTELGVASHPTVSMVDLPQVNQDACKGARLRLVFRARAYRSAAHARGVR
jgi:hypothetical protein